ncbi:flavodoxin family protein [Gordonia jinghuaiqii]|uniref:NAD(P)H-dependent oxidoreductase n=1 Tax=Gordonia jinghuaiqii TaxID=2758710 RepID=A0A7D7LSS5_9ACTN|nr:NAD(P)H-dependent oxidoreductase [Gordonia jinghuaiqii]MCR5976675.1 flavodoxin family protein [Gordonia jinghuaiqii]QMS99854.1 NAD(P)H-dependent oxidoreductase [Gordonia jinghuaiqii]
MSLFRLDSSIFPSTSASRALGDLVEEQWVRAHPDSGVVRRDLGTDPIPTTAWADAVIAGTVSDADRTGPQREASALAAGIADQLVEAEALLFTVPLYNFGVSQHFKIWYDLAATDPRLGAAADDLSGKPAVLVTAQGGNYEPGTPREGWDHSTPWLRRVLEDVWGLDLRIVKRQFTLVGVNPALDAFADVAATMKNEAEVDARRLGRELARARGEDLAASNP